MDSALSPREIQSRIRSGVSLEDVAAEAGVSVDQVEPFAVPVLAELEHILETALDCPVRRHADPGAHRGLRSVVSQVSASHGIDEADLHWRCWRHQDRSWVVLASWQGEPGPGEGQATFRFDPRGRYSSPQDAGARWLVDDRGPVSGPKTGPDNPDEEPTIDLHDELAIVRAVSDRPQRGASRTGRRPEAVSTPPQPDDATDGTDRPLPALPGMTETNGVYDFAPSSDQQMDTLYEMLAGFQEDSVNIYQGLEDPPVVPAAPDSEPDDSGSASDQTPSELTSDSDRQSPKARSSSAKSARSEGRPEEPALDLEETPDTKSPPGGRRRRKSSRGKRASVPSWDEIMFGGPTPHV